MDSKNRKAEGATPTQSPAMPERLHRRGLMIYTGEDTKRPGKSRLFADAQRIASAIELVRRYNSHAALVAACADVEGRILRVAHGGKLDAKTILDVLRSALSAARGGAR